MIERKREECSVEAGRGKKAPTRAASFISSRRNLSALYFFPSVGFSARAAVCVCAGGVVRGGSGIPLQALSKTAHSFAQARASPSASRATF
jgi:hypothetical protein